MPYDLKTLNEFDESGSTFRLPEISIPMRPDQVSFDDDISDKELFNECFIETRLSEGEGASLLYVLMMAHNIFLMGVVIMLYYLVTEGFDYAQLIMFVVYALVVKLILYMFKALATPDIIRFNRQAQMVHYLSGNKVISVPWRDVKPYITYRRIYSSTSGMVRISYNLLLVANDPEDIGDTLNPNIVIMQTIFTVSDSVSADWIMRRLEFIRRYMETGLDSIQPSQENIEESRVEKLTGYEKLSLGNLFFYLVGAGPLVDYWIKQIKSKMPWSDEVIRLCSEGADLSGIDTTSVNTIPGYYYDVNELSQSIMLEERRQSALSQ